MLVIVATAAFVAGSPKGRGMRGRRPGPLVRLAAAIRFTLLGDPHAWYKERREREREERRRLGTCWRPQSQRRSAA
jgi:hypothetical protein